MNITLNSLINQGAGYNDKHIFEYYVIDRVNNRSPIQRSTFLLSTLPICGVDLHGNLINREVVDNPNQRNRQGPDGLQFYDWSFKQVFADADKSSGSSSSGSSNSSNGSSNSSSSIYPILVRLNFTWEAYTYNPDAFLSEFRYILSLAKETGTPLLLDFFLAFTSSTLYSIAGSADITPSNPYRGFGFPSAYTSSYANMAVEEYYKHKAFWDDFLNNKIKHPTTYRSMWDDFIDFFNLIIKEASGGGSSSSIGSNSNSSSIVWGYEFLNEPFLFTLEHFSLLKEFYTYVYEQIKHKIHSTTWIVWGKPVLFGDARPNYYDPEKWKLYVPSVRERSLVSGHVYADPSNDPKSEFYKRMRAYTAAASMIPSSSSPALLSTINKVLITEHNRPLNPDTSTFITSEMVNQWVDLYKNTWKVYGVLWHTWGSRIKETLSYTPNLQYYDKQTKQRVITEHGQKWVEFIQRMRELI
ncbi:MAG: hypothetical protein QXI92_05405 [Candidatus Nitrosocaldus sp.]